MFAPVKFALGKEPRVATMPSKVARERSAPSKCAFASLMPRKLTSFRVAPARLAPDRSAPSRRTKERSAPAKSVPTSVQLWSDAERSRAPAKKALVKSRKSRSQCSKIAPGPETPSHLAWRRVARVKSVPASVAREKSARVRSARLRSLPDRSMPARSAPVRSGVTFAFLTRHSFHAGVARSFQCSGFAIVGHCNRPGSRGALQSIA